MPRVAWFSPNSGRPISKSYIFLKSVLPALSESWNLEIFVDDNSFRDVNRSLAGELSQGADGLENLSDFRSQVFHFHRYYQREKLGNFDFHIYNFENSSNCQFVERQSQLYPGISIFHDLRLNSIFESRINYSTAAQAYNDLMDSQFGEDSIRLGDYHARDWPYQVFSLFYPMGRNIIQNADVSLSIAGVGESYIRSLRKNRPSYFLQQPVIFNSQISKPKTNELAEIKVVGCIGSSIVIDRLPLILETFELMAQRGENVEFKWIIDDVSNAVELSDYCDRFFESTKELRSNFKLIVPTSEQDYLDQLACCSLLVLSSVDEMKSPPLGIDVALINGMPVLSLAGSSIAQPIASLVFELPLELGNAKGLASTIGKLIAEKGFSEKLRAKAKNQISSNESSTNNAEILKQAAEENLLLLTRKKGEKINLLNNARDELLHKIRANNDDIALREIIIDFSW